MELNEDEFNGMVEALRRAGLHPKADTAQDFKDWIGALPQGSAIKQESVEKEGAASIKKAADVTYHTFPKLPAFSGEVGKDTEYDLWHYQVECLMETRTYSQDTILRAIRTSLKGEAAMIVMNLGHRATTTDIMLKLKSAFGTLRRSSVLMSAFYSASQREDEDVSAWSCRLERLLYQLSEQKTIPAHEQDEMLRSRLWDGLNSDIKSLAGYKYDVIDNFDDLRLCLREMELELNKGKVVIPRTKGKPLAVNVATASRSQEGQDEMTTLLREMRTEMKDMRDEQKRMTAQINHLQSRPVPSFHRQETQSNSQSPGFQNAFPDRKQYTGCPGSEVRQAPPEVTSYPRQGIDSNYREVTCWRCGYPGHMARGCRVRLDHLRRPLNGNKPMGRGHS